MAFFKVMGGVFKKLVRICLAPRAVRRGTPKPIRGTGGTVGSRYPESPVPRENTIQLDEWKEQAHNSVIG